MSRLPRLPLAWLLLAACVAPGCKESLPDYPSVGESQRLGSLAGAPGRAPAAAGDVTFARLLQARAEPQNWLTYYGAYDGWRYSELTQINRETVKTLRPAWTFQFGQIGLSATAATYALEAAPLVVDGVMFLSGWDGYVLSLIHI